MVTPRGGVSAFQLLLLKDAHRHLCISGISTEGINPNSVTRQRYELWILADLREERLKPFGSIFI